VNTLHLRRPNGNSRREHHNGAAHEAPEAPAPAPQTPPAPAPQPQAPVIGLRDWVFDTFSGPTAAINLPGGYFQATWATPAATGDLYFEHLNSGTNQWESDRCFNVMSSSGTTGFTLAGSDPPQFRCNFTGLGTASITLALV
jgi:hypothetical protein